jgi:hypothetical protein
MPNNNNPNLLRRRVDNSTMITGLVCPVRNALCTFEFADIDYPSHRGIDIVSVGSDFSDPRQTRHFFTSGSDSNCYAVATGIVTNLRTGIGNLPLSANSLGNFVQIRESNGNISRYAHLASVAVKVGDTVTRGQIIGVIGNTGSSTARHLHFDYSVNGRMIDTLRPRASQQRTSTIKGDVNGNGVITIADALEIMNYLANLPSVIVRGNSAWNAACILGNEPTIQDVLEILLYLAGLDSALGKCNEPLLREYIIKRGDRLGKIASDNRLTLDELMTYNPHIPNPNIINVGDKVYIPLPR